MDWNPKDPPRYGGLKIDGVPPFKTAIEFEFDPEVNVFIGPNATGKSTLLKLLSPEYEESGKLLDEGDYSIERAGDSWLDSYRNRLVVSGPRQTRVNRGTVPVVYLPPVREVAPPYPEEFADDDSHPEHRYGGFYVAKADKLLEDRMDGLPNYDDEISAAMGGWSQLVGLAEEGINPREVRSTREKPWKWEELSRRDRERRSGANKELWLDAYPFTTFDTNRVHYALEKLADDETRTGSGRAAAAVIEVTRACLRDICPEVIQGNLASYPVDVPLDPAAYVDEYDASYGPTKVRGNVGMGVHITGEDKAVYMGDLSTGTQGLSLWIYYLALKVGEHYSFSEGSDANRRSLRWWDQPAILLIDEIENHLHPTWQRRVIPALRKHFPGLQIFATTHSPFVVAGLKRGQVHRLYREKGVIKTDQLTEEEKEHKLVGWTVEQILRKFMDVTDPTDEETAMAAAALRWLQGRQAPPDVKADVWVQERIDFLDKIQERTRDETVALAWLTERQQKDPWLTERQQKEGDKAAIDAVELTEQQKEGDKVPKDAVEWRAWVLEELRTLVSLDIEAGGPFAAQRERFTAQLRKLLAKDQTGSQDPEEEG